MRRGERPLGLEPRLAAALDAADCGLDLRSVPEDLARRVEAAYGQDGLIELVVLAGFYRLIASVIFCFDVPLPEGEEHPFPA